MMIKTTLATLAAVLCLGISSVRAEQIPICEYLLGDARWGCGLNFAQSEAGQTRACDIKHGAGFPRWTDNSQIIIDTDTLTEAGQQWLNKMKPIAKKTCQCDIRLTCKRILFARDGNNVMPESGGHQDVECSGISLEDLQTMTWNAGTGTMSPDC